MNELFVNIKVDREERPDVDALYMDAVQAMTGRGGWPMTAFLAPTGDPFYGGTYFPKPQFLQLMTAIDDVWRNRPADIQQNVTALGDALRRSTRAAREAGMFSILCDNSWSMEDADAHFTDWNELVEILEAR